MHMGHWMREKLHCCSFRFSFHCHVDVSCRHVCVIDEKRFSLSSLVNFGDVAVRKL